MRLDGGRNINGVKLMTRRLGVDHRLVGMWRRFNIRVLRGGAVDSLLPHAPSAVYLSAISALSRVLAPQAMGKNVSAHSRALSRGCTLPESMKDGEIGMAGNGGPSAAGEGCMRKRQYLAESRHGISGGGGVAKEMRKAANGRQKIPVTFFAHLLRRTHAPLHTRGK